MQKENHLGHSKIPKKTEVPIRGIRGWIQHPQAFLSGLMSFFLPGSGQLRNRQWYKAIPFFVMFVAVVAIELGTSNYFQARAEMEKYPIITLDMVEGGTFYGVNRTKDSIVNGHVLSEEEVSPGGEYYLSRRVEGDFVLVNGEYQVLTAADVASGGDFYDSIRSEGDIVSADGVTAPYQLTVVDVGTGGAYANQLFQAGDVTKIRLSDADVSPNGAYYQSYRRVGDQINYTVTAADLYPQGPYFQTERQVGDIVRYVVAEADLDEGGLFAGSGKNVGDMVMIPLTEENITHFAGYLSHGDVRNGRLLTEDSDVLLKVGDLCLEANGTYKVMTPSLITIPTYQVPRKAGDIISADGLTDPVLMDAKAIAKQGRFFGTSTTVGSVRRIILTETDVSMGGDFYQSYRMKNDMFFVYIDEFDIIPNQIDLWIAEGRYSAVLGVEADNVADRIYFFRDYGGWFTRGIWGLITLGQLPTVTRGSAVWYRGWRIIVSRSASQMDYPKWVVADNSTRLMTNGVMSLVALMILGAIWLMNVTDAYRSHIRIAETGVIEKPKAFYRRFWDDYFAYIIVIPTFLLISFFTLIPFAFSFMTSFTSWNSNIAVPSELIDWRGLFNFGSVFTGSGVNLRYFGNVFIWTLEFAIFASLTCYVFGLIQALIIQSKSVIAKKFWRTVFILPWAIPSLVTLLMFRSVFSPAGGLANQLIDSLSDPNNQYVLIQKIKSVLSAFGLFRGEMSVYAGAGNIWEKIRIFFQVLGFGGKNAAESIYSHFTGTYIGWFQFANYRLGRFLILAINLWIGYPYFMLLITGTLTSIPADMYEAADIDGATNWQKTKYITLPWILRATMPVIITTLTHNFNNFGVIYFLTGSTPSVTYRFLTDGTMSQVGAPNGAPSIYDILISWVYRLAMMTTVREYNIAAVYSIIIFMIVGIFSVYNLSRMKSFWEED
jgi:arabinogalactan oligomer/maltooligosaccharide transport system permease protein